MESVLKAIQEGDSQYLKATLNQINLTEFYEGKTLLHLACQQGFLPIVKIIVAALKSYKLAGFIDTKDLVSGRTPLILTLLSSDDGNPSLVRYLLSSKANFTLTDQHGCSPLHYAAHNGQDQNLQILLDKQADLDQENEEGLTPLHLSLKEKQFNAFRLLIEKGANLSIIHPTEGSLLHYAINNGVSGPQYLNVLLQSVDKQLKDRNGKTAYDYAKELKLKRAIPLLSASPAKSSTEKYYLIGIIVMIAGWVLYFLI